MREGEGHETYSHPVFIVKSEHFSEGLVLSLFKIVPNDGVQWPNFGEEISVLDKPQFWRQL